MLTKITHYFATWKLQRKTIHQLAMLSDHELDDIGLNRANIHAIVRKNTRYSGY